LKNQKKNPTTEDTTIILGLKGANTSEDSGEEGKRKAREPLYLLRYE